MQKEIETKRSKL